MPGPALQVDTDRYWIAFHGQRHGFPVLQPLDFHRAEVQFFGQHLQVAGDDGRGYGHHLVRLRVDLHEHLAVPPVCRFHFRDNRLAREQLFLLRFVRSVPAARISGPDRRPHPPARSPCG